ncbi:aminoglycoside phosphotransferase family protein [Cohnella xylanilytica]|uniref:Aminoglycoside phosphotransferase family protein n=1 Tax=Cohnella xylanilytica TaxID=557555 RepID=A0A841U505_9BACL|nr:aminoglycoside phosphotransferase family protein [Cohnella xylanilytica]MBB6695696.1 aminoglycoside phosphotransferase family protein [Cohnella xylanilytica]
MEGTNKVKVRPEELNRLARAAFDCGVAESLELTDGWANSAYKLVLDDGRKAVLKVAPTKNVKQMRYERNMMRAEVDAMRLMREVGGVPVPEVYLFDESETILPASYFIMEHLEGEPYNKARETMTPERRETVERELGVLNRRINEVKGNRFGLFAYETPYDDSWREAFRWLIRGVLEDGREMGVGLPAPYEEFEREIERRLPALDEVKEPRLVHWDLWAGNVFVQGDRITGIIDFERAMWGDPLIEHYFSHFDDTTAFKQGHGWHAEEPGRRIRRSLYDLYLDLILVVECQFRQYTDRDHVEWTANNLAAGWERFRSI